MDTHPDTGIAFYVNNGQGGVQGLQILPNGTKRLQNACRTNYNKRGRKKYLYFRDAWGTHRGILAARAVYIANRGEIPEDKELDHIDCNEDNNDIRNLRAISRAENNACRGFCMKIRNKGIDPTRIQRPILLRYFSRMAKFKAKHNIWYYRKLSKQDLTFMLYETNEFIKSRFENGAHPKQK